MTENQSQNLPSTIKKWALRAGLAGLFGGLLTGLSKGGGIVPIADGFALPCGGRGRSRCCRCTRSQTGSRLPVKVFTSAVVFATCSVNLSAQPSVISEQDQQNRFSISRPAHWEQQDRPRPTTRMMFGFRGDGYIGTCNINLLSSKGTATLTQGEVDRTENQKKLTGSFFETSLRGVSKDLQVQSVRQVQRGGHFGHLVNYTYSYFSRSLNAQVRMRAELFSHSRPGSVFSFTCSTGALTELKAQKAFAVEGRSFERLSSSLRTD